MRYATLPARVRPRPDRRAPAQAVHSGTPSSPPVRAEPGCFASVHRLPPGARNKFLVHIDDLTDARSEQIHVARVRRRDGALDRFVPIVKSEIEGPPMRREHATRADVAMRAHRILGAHVDVQPRCTRSIRANLDDAEIERTETSTDRTEVIRVT